MRTTGDWRCRNHFLYRHAFHVPTRCSHCIWYLGQSDRAALENDSIILLKPLSLRSPIYRRILEIFLDLMLFYLRCTFRMLFICNKFLAFIRGRYKTARQLVERNVNSWGAFPKVLLTFILNIRDSTWVVRWLFQSYSTWRYKHQHYADSYKIIYKRLVEFKSGRHQLAKISCNPNCNLLFSLLSPNKFEFWKVCRLLNQLIQAQNWAMYLT